MATSLEAERVKQRRWRLRPQFAHAPWFDRLIEREFLPPEAQAAQQAQALQDMVRFAVRRVAHYRDLFDRLGLQAEDIRQPSDLARLPTLTRRQVRELSPVLQARKLPPGQSRGGPTRTSGSTGEPVVVEHTRHSHFMFTVLKQREHRWADLDPAWTAGAIYSPRDLPPMPDGSLAHGGVTCRLPGWTHVGAFFVTGPFVGFDCSCPLPLQLAWLEQQRPNYLMSMSANLEQLALAFQDRSPPDYLRATKAVAQQLTPSMRRTIETILQIPVQNDYGFNEIGLVACQCPEGGRFHVHAEHCVVEIVGADGGPCRPGEFGRVLVTGLSNAAMPLLRYDPDDLAMALEGPCPCGRTLPSFGPIQGRYRRTAFLPPGVWSHWIAIQRAIGDMPLELLAPLRQYQVHHHRDGRFVLRVALSGCLAPEFRARIQAAWQEADRVVAFPLEMVDVEEIPFQPGVKYLSFTSDLIPPPDWEPPPGSAQRTSEEVKTGEFSARDGAR
jgi:phenylacetate-CoA ligase